MEPNGPIKLEVKITAPVLGNKQRGRNAKMEGFVLEQELRYGVHLEFQSSFRFKNLKSSNAPVAALEINALISSNMLFKMIIIHQILHLIS